MHSTTSTLARAQDSQWPSEDSPIQPILPMFPEDRDSEEQHSGADSSLPQYGWH